MARSRIICWIAGTLAAVSAAVLFFELHVPGPGIELRPHRALGEVAAEETLKLAGDGRLILIDRDIVTFESPPTAAHLKSFHQALKKAGRSVALTNSLKVDPLRVMAVPPGDFFELLRRTSDKDVIVSFLGPPNLNPEQTQRLGAKHARVLAFCPGNIPRQVDLRRLFQQGLLHAVIIDRATPLARPGESDPLRSWFDQTYLAVTADRLDELDREVQASR